MLFTRSGRIVHFDRDAERLFGWRSDEVVEKPVSVLFPAGQHRPCDAVLASPQSVPAHGFVCEAEGLRKQGAAFPMECAISACRLDGDVVFLAVLQDLQEARRHANEVVHMDRMMSLGKLAAGVAHEINNPLSYLISNLEFLRREIDDVADSVNAGPTSGGSTGEHGGARDLAARIAALREALWEARDGAERIRKVARDLRTFAHVDEDRRELVPLSQALDSAIALAWIEIRHRASLVREYDAAPAVMANEQRLVQVFLNLLVNAAQAIPEGAPEANEIRVRSIREGDRVQIGIADTGQGIEPSDLSRLFEPFFTTKPPGKGTGLGLSVARDIVHAIGGEIAVESQPGRGTIFRIDLPAARCEAPPPLRSEPSLGPSKRARILVVDDEPLIGSAIRRMLGDEHHVLDVSSGRKALSLLEAGTEFDVILCDVMMPHMSGEQVHDALSARFPALLSRVAFITGGPSSEAAQGFLARVSNRRLEKPFEREGLRNLIGDLLG